MEQRRVQTERVIQQLGTAVQLTVNVTKNAFQTGADLAFNWSVSAGNLTLEQALETELYESQLRELYNAILEIDVRAAVSSTSETISSTRDAAVRFFNKHGSDVLASLITIATAKTVERNSPAITSAGKAAVLGTWTLANQIFNFIKGNTPTVSMTWITQLWSWFKCARPNDLIPIPAQNLQQPNPSAIIVHDLLNTPGWSSKGIIATFIVNLVVVDHFMGNGYVVDFYDRSTTRLEDAVEMIITVSLPAIPSGLVYFGLSTFLATGPASALAGATYAFGLALTLYQRSNEETKKKVDAALEQTLISR
jgi:hypothetical protein